MYNFIKLAFLNGELANVFMEKPFDLDDFKILDLRLPKAQ